MKLTVETNHSRTLFKMSTAIIGVHLKLIEIVSTTIVAVAQRLVQAIENMIRGRSSSVRARSNRHEPGVREPLVDRNVQLIVRFPHTKMNHLS